MALPEAVRESVGRALHEIGFKSGISSESHVGGGCINNGVRLGCGGESFFLKWNASSPPGMFAAEAEGLEALRDGVARSGGDAKIPQPIAWGEDVDGSWLLLEYVEASHALPTSERRLGRALADLHAAGASPSGAMCSLAGWPSDNWIGSLPQDNTPTSDWPSFWRDRRIVPQLQMARGSGHLRDALFDSLVEAIPDALAGSFEPRLLHGDLWSGNAYFASDGSPVLIDPAAYKGDSEVDLAMTELFGGFGPSFRAEYEEAIPLTDEYVSHRRDLYQLYYLMVHVNLFGAGYVAGTTRAAKRVLASLR